MILHRGDCYVSLICIGILQFPRYEVHYRLISDTSSFSGMHNSTSLTIIILSPYKPILPVYFWYYLDSETSVYIIYFVLVLSFSTKGICSIT